MGVVLRYLIVLGGFKLKLKHAFMKKEKNKKINKSLKNKKKILY